MNLDCWTRLPGEGTARVRVVAMRAVLEMARVFMPEEVELGRTSD